MCAGLLCPSFPPSAALVSMGTLDGDWVANTLPFTFLSAFASLGFIYCPRKKKATFPQEAVLVGRQAERSGQKEEDGDLEKGSSKGSRPRQGKQGSRRVVLASLQGSTRACALGPESGYDLCSVRILSFHSLSQSGARARGLTHE